MKSREIIEKVHQTIDYAAPVIIAIVGVWSQSIDITAYVLGGAALVNSALEYAKLFIKEKS